MDHRITPGTTGMPLMPEGTPIKVAVATAIVEVHVLTKEALPREVSREIRFFRGTPSQLEQKSATFGKTYMANIDEVLNAASSVLAKAHPVLQRTLDQAHAQFDQAFDEELYQMGAVIHAAPTFEKAQTAALDYLHGPFNKNIEGAFQELAKVMENIISIGSR